MINDKKVSGIILIAGRSSRFHSNSNKVLWNINDIPVFLYSLRIFSYNKYIDDIILVIKDGEEESITLALTSFETSKKIHLITGGCTRQESVFNALKFSDSDLVVVHDGARPMIKDEYISDSLMELNNYAGTTIAVKSKDTIKIADDNNVVIETTRRQNTWIIQTPQCFDRKILLDAHVKQNGNPDITDDCMMLENDGYKVKLIEGDYTNLKLTTRDDFNVLVELLKNAK